MTPTLHKRPEATTFAIEDLVPMARGGRFRLPPIQRPFKWESRHVRDLFDSIYRGFPIGTLLLWKKEAEASRIRFGPPQSAVEFEAGPRSDALFIIDGQQRISSLVGVLSSATSSGVFRLFFDLDWEDARPESRQITPFVPGDTARVGASTLLPMNVVLDSEQLDAWLDESGVRAAKPEHARRARRLNKLVREYKIPAYVVETENVEDLVLIFERVNNAGKRLDKSEVFNASLISAGGGRDLRDLAREVRDAGFGDIDQKTLRDVLYATKDLDITNVGHEGERKVLGDPGAMADASSALFKAIELIRRDADIPHASLLPYTFPLVLLAKFFHHHPEPGPRSRALLVRWLWRGAITGHHRAEQIPNVRAQHKDLDEKSGLDEESAVQRLLGHVPRDRPPVRLGPFRFGTAQSKLELLALASLAPRDLVDGGAAEIGPLFAGTARGPMNVGALLEEHGSHAVLTISEGERTLASRLIHPPIQRRLLLGALRSARPEVLMSHGIGLEASMAVRAGDFARAIELRNRFLSEYIESFLDAHARWGETDRPSLAWLSRRPPQESRDDGPLL